MENRQNEFLTEVVKQGILISKNKGDISALLNLQKSGVPQHVINRVLLSYDKIRSTDLEGQ